MLRKIGELLPAVLCTMRDSGWHAASGGDNGEPGGVRAPPPSPGPDGRFCVSSRRCCCRCSRFLMRKILGILVDAHFTHTDSLHCILFTTLNCNPVAVPSAVSRQLKSLLSTVVQRSDRPRRRGEGGVIVKIMAVTLGQTARATVLLHLVTSPSRTRSP